MIKKLIIVYACLFIINCYMGHSQPIVAAQATDEKSRELGYLYAFSEATKMFIFGDYGRAANLYRECLKYEPRSAAVHYQLAELYLKAGDIKIAHRYSFKAHDFDPENKWYTIQLANVYQAEQMYDSAVILYKSLLSGTGGDIRLYFQISSILEKKGKYRDAIEYLNKIERKTGVTRETAIGKSRILDNMGLEKEAGIQLRFALSGKEEDYIIYGMIAEHFRKYHRNDSAQYYYNKILTDHQEDANVMFSYGEFLLELNRLKEARYMFAKLFENRKIDENTKLGYLYNAIQDPGFFKRVKPVMDTVVNVLLKNSNDNIRIMSLYSDINYRLGNYAESSRILMKIMDRDPENFAAWEQLIFCESAMEKPDSVIYYGELAISRFEQRPLPYLMVSSVCYTRKDYKKAIGLLEKGEMFADTDALKMEFYSLLAECYSRVEDTVRSDKFYERALMIDSLNIAILNNFAYSLAVRGYNLRRAETMSRYTILAEPVNSTYLDTYAWVLFKMGNIKGAGKFIKKAILNGGDRNADVLDHYGDILIKRGKTRKAVSIWKEASKFAEEELKGKLNDKLDHF